MVVGLVGCGRWGKHILRDLIALGCEVPVVARSEASRARAEDGGASVIASTIGELPALDGAIVATTTSTHAGAIEELLGRGIPIYVEKPLTNDLATATLLAEAALDTLFVMDKWRYHAGVMELGAIARERRLGQVRGLRSVRSGWGNPHDDVDMSWVLTPHELAIALEVMGAVPTPEAAVALAHDDEALFLTGILRGDGWWHALEVSSRSPERVRRVELHCDDGVAVLAGGWDEHISIYRAASAGEGERIETPGELPLLAELRRFVDHVAGGPPPKSSAAEGASVVRAVAGLRHLAGLA